MATTLNVENTSAKVGGTLSATDLQSLLTAIGNLNIFVLPSGASIANVKQFSLAVQPNGSATITAYIQS